MQTPEPLTPDRLDELCELAKKSPRGYMVEIRREELWALVDMAKEAKESASRIDELQNLLERFSYAVEGHAWAMPPPNVWTPVFLSTVNAARMALCDIKAGRKKHND